ncbi:cytochrome P450 [Sphingomonas sp. MMS24-JH45]
MTSPPAASSGSTSPTRTRWRKHGRIRPTSTRCRFAPENARGRHRFAWVPFGGGAHMCIGLHFATMQSAC